MFEEGKIFRNPRTFEVLTVIASGPKFDNYVVISSNMGGFRVVPPSIFVDFIPDEHFTDGTSVFDEAEKSQDIIDRARRFSITAHNQANKFYGKTLLYGHHLGDVVDEGRFFRYLVPAHDYNIVESCLWGHDSVEDTGITYNDVKAELGPLVADGIYAMTNFRGKTRDERACDGYYMGLKDFQYGEFMKLCDRIGNVKHSFETGGSMFKKYHREQEEFEYKLRSGDKYADMWNHLKKILMHGNNRSSKGSPAENHL